jgi:CRP-like cAMP-binding protein
MISPELLRRYPFFGQLTDRHLKAIAMISEEEEAKAGTIIFEEKQPARSFYFLIDGSIDLIYSVEEGLKPKTRKEFNVGEINPQEVFGISALIEPYIINATGKAAKDCRYIIIEAKALLAMMEMDYQMGYIFMQHIAKAAMERLVATRVQLAATRT